MTKRELIDVSPVLKRGSSLRIVVPKKVEEQLELKTEDIVGFYKDGDMLIIDTLR